MMILSVSAADTVHMTFARLGNVGGHAHLVAVMTRSPRVGESGRLISFVLSIEREVDVPRSYCICHSKDFKCAICTASGAPLLLSSFHREEAGREREKATTLVGSHLCRGLFL